MKKIAKNMLTLSLGLALYALPACAQSAAGANSQAQVSRVSVAAERQTVRFVAPEDGAARRLVVATQEGDVLYDSGFTSGTTLEWSLKNSQGNTIASGLYNYTLTTKAQPNALPVTEQGQVLVERAGSQDRILLTSGSQAGVGAEGRLLKLTLVDEREGRGRTTDGAGSTRQGNGRTLSAPQTGATANTPQRASAVPEANGVFDAVQVNAQLVVGDSSGTDALEIRGTGGTYRQLATHNERSVGAEFYTHDDAAFRGAVLGLFKSRGTRATPTAVQNGDNLGYINFGGYNGTGYVTGGSIWSRAGSNWSGTDNGADLQFYVTPSGSTTPTRGLYIAPTGNVSVGGGAAISNNTLSVVGSLSVGSTAYKDATGPTNGAIISGSVGIGTTNPSNFKLQVAGNVGPDSDNAYNFGSALNRWGALYATNGTIQTSDARLKQRVTNLNYGLREVMKLRPITFQWKDNSDTKQHLGLVAQEVEQVIPEVVHRDANSKAPLGMSYDNLVPVVIKAVQEQQTTITSLQTENAELKQQNAALEARLSALEKKMGTNKARR